jgi:hypothetical protein
VVPLSYRSPYHLARLPTPHGADEDGNLCECDSYVAWARHGDAELVLSGPFACLSVQAIAEAIDALREREDERDAAHIYVLEQLFNTLRLAHLTGWDPIAGSGPGSSAELS